MRRLNYFELDLPLCGNVAGVSPCTATQTGDAKCYNSRATCNDLANFRLSTPNVDGVVETQFASDTTAHAVRLPHVIGAGDLLLCLLATDGSATVTTPAGWRALHSAAIGTSVRGSVYAKVATGTEDTAVASVGAITLTTGTPFGDLTGGNGLFEPFDLDTTRIQADTASKAAALSGYVGKRFSSAKSVFGCTVYGSTDLGFYTGAATITLNLRGKNGSIPTSDTDGTIIGTVTFVDTSNESAGRALTMSDQSTRWDYWFVQITHNAAAATIGIAEITLTESFPVVDFITSATEQAASQVYHVLANRWKGAIDPATIGVAISGNSATATATPDPPALIAPWGEATNLWITAVFTSSVLTVDDYPSGFADGLLTLAGTSTTGASVASAYVVAKESDMDPGAFEMDGADDHISVTIAVQPLRETTLRFSTAAMYQPKNIEAFPCVLSMEHSPQVVSLGENLGERASISVKLEDSPHSDTGPGYDPYLSGRTYNPYLQGTHWGKFRARHAFIHGSPCRLIRGLEGEALASMETKHFVVDGIEGPSVDWQFEITAKDILKLLDGDKAQAPLVNTATANEALDASELGIDLAPEGIGDQEFDTSGWVCVGGKEICSYTRAANSDVLTVVRGQLGTTGTTHDSGVRVQVVLAYVGEDVADILFDLLVNYGGVPAHLIPLNSWRSETATFLNRLYTGYVTEPTSVKKLCAELIEQAALAVWASDNPPQINLQVLRAVASSAATIDETLIRESTLAISERSEKRLSQVWTFYSPRDKTRPLDEESNYAAVLATVDSDAEADYATAGIKKIYSRWIPSGGTTAAERVNELLLSQYRRAPRRFIFGLFPGGEINPSLGNGYRISVPQIQDQNGAQDSIPIIVTSIKSQPDGLLVTADELQLGALSLDIDGNVLQWNSDENNIDLLTAHNELYADAVSGDNVYAFVSSGVVIGSVSTGIPAFTIDGFAAGVNIYLIVQGRIQGRGGKGGNGGQGAATGNQGIDGGDGGTALYVRDPVNIDASLGDIFSGGGGGGGGEGGGGSGDDGDGGGGGGGAGTIPGAAGSGGGSSANAGTSGAGGDGGSGQDGQGGRGDGGAGADGGDPGEDAGNGGGGGGAGNGVGSGGDAGNAVDGDSFLTYGVVDSAGAFTPGATGSEDIRGGEIN